MRQRVHHARPQPTSPQVPEGEGLQCSLCLWRILPGDLAALGRDMRGDPAAVCIWCRSMLRSDAPEVVEIPGGEEAYGEIDYCES